MQGIDDNFGDRFERQVQRTFAGCVEVSIHPDEGFASGLLPRRRVSRLGKAPMQVPCGEKPFSFGILMRQAAAGSKYVCVVQKAPGISLSAHLRRDESRRGRHECLRHMGWK
jgi:hypothetical protein